MLALLVGELLFILPVGDALAAIGFEQKINNLNQNLVSRVLPLVATCGLIYGGFLMATGNSEGRGKIMAVIGGAIIALLAPSIMRFLAGAF
ncbi:MAG: hypothetical protein OXB84_08090 [Halobacteriovoraceae bacterium]|nr:hypothetical protein [Halobacteriovoraceae bacterium]